jgi:GTP cyclohydrolase II
VGDSDHGGEAGAFGAPGRVAVERGLAEFRCARPVIITGADTILALPVDGLDNQRLAIFRKLSEPARPHLAITPRRAQVFGLDANGPVGLGLDEKADAKMILALAADADRGQSREVVSTSATAGAAIELAKLAQQLPALLITKLRHVPAAEPALISVCADEIKRYRESAVASLAIAADSYVPLTGGISTRFVVFHDAIGGSAVAVVVGRPDFSRPMPVRLHSACLTGDVFGSRRCDCGDQLRLALRRLDEEGGGIVLYLEQEGRGLGLANKIRAYRLQDAGLDTLDANHTLGFDDDERDYGIAARMLDMLGCKQVRLLTNNPAKLDGLAEHGIEVVDRIPLHGPVNADNRRYLTAKAERAGHQLDNLLEIADAGDVTDKR